MRTTLLNQKNEGVVYSGAHTIAGRDVLLVEVDTDEDVRGISFLTGMEIAYGSEIRAIELIIREGLRPMVVGEELWRTERIWDKMYRSTVRFGRKGAAVRAISGVDLCIWDALGKAQNRPLWQILGGYREKVPAYVTCGYYGQGKGLDSLVEEARGFAESGFTGIKIKVGRASLSQDTERVKAVRDAIGDDVKLMVDANGAWDTISAIRAARKWECHDLYWIEEPVAPDNLEGYQAVAASTSIPIAAGENEYTRFGFKELIQRKAVGIIQADVTRVGGVTEWLRVVHLAGAYDIPCAPHGVQELHAHLVAALPEGVFVEYFARDHALQRFIDQLFVEPHETKTAVEGHILPPSLPGLGLEVSTEAVERYRVDRGADSN